MLDDLDELRTFKRILTSGSLSAAARDLGVSLAVVSKRLASLERRAGQRLINRTTRRLSPTNEGLALVPHVERMLEELAAAEARMASGWEEPQGLLRVSAPISFGRIHLLPLAAQLVEQYPRLDIELKLEDRLVDLTDEKSTSPFGSVNRETAARSCTCWRRIAEYWSPRPLILIATVVPILSATFAAIFVCATTITRCPGGSKDLTEIQWNSSRAAVCGPTVETPCTTGRSPGTA